VPAEGGTVSRQLEVLNETQQRIFLEVHATSITQTAPADIKTLVVVWDVTDIARTAAVKAEFAANASHELRTPLATIRAAVDSLESHGPEDREAFNKFTDILDRHVRRLELMTNDLLDLHMAEQSASGMKIAEIPLVEVREWLKSHFRAQARSLELDFQVNADSQDHPPLRSDRRMIHLILQNLVDNAMKFTPAGGTVTCSLNWRNEDLIITVSDTGCGIPQDMQDRIFERFFQVDASRTSMGAPRRGTGLGLAIVKHAVERIGASAELTSQPGEGTTVTVTVPTQARRAVESDR
jgi:two-component system phosphate regulon sensor histidine kinase PhoR